jgi:hypothetical protein
MPANFFGATLAFLTVSDIRTLASTAIGECHVELNALSTGDLCVAARPSIVGIGEFNGIRSRNIQPPGPHERICCPGQAGDCDSEKGGSKHHLFVFDAELSS